MRLSKKGVSIWISWVLIIAMMAILAAFVFLWMNQFTESSTTRMKEVYDSVDCNYVAISVDEICQNTQTLNMNITNSKNIDIDKLIFRIYDIYGNPDGKEVKVFIRHGTANTEKVEIIKQGVTDSLDIIPIVIKDNKKIICEDRKAEISNIKFCS
jgi:hypothetical protein